MTPKLNRVMRLDSLPLNQTFFTPEGYLRDKPILTSTGIFEYKNPDGSIRRELRLPEEVFAKESLESYKGKPIIITHDAGLIDKENVHEEQIGTILSTGYRDGNDVRAEIVIHDTDEMKDCGYKELSLGYNLDLDETEGVYNGQHYDAIQRNIRVNHLALVREARAGDQARLNIDSRDNLSILKGGKAKMSVFNKKNAKKARRADSNPTPEELEKAIAAWKARKQADCVKNDEDGTKDPNAPAAVGGELSPEEKIAKINARKAAIDEKEEPKDKEEAMSLVMDQDDIIAQQDELIQALVAERDFNKKTDSDDKEEEAEEVATDDGDEENAGAFTVKHHKVPAAAEEDGDEEEIPEDEEEDGDDEEEEDEPKLNADSLDYIAKQRYKLGKAGEILNLDGLENMSLKNAKKAVVNAVRPTMRLDGKTNAYVDAAFDMAYAEIIKSNKKDISYQYKQMFNKDSKSARTTKKSGANAARESMMKRMFEKGDK